MKTRSKFRHSLQQAAKDSKKRKCDRNADKVYDRRNKRQHDQSPDSLLNDGRIEMENPNAHESRNLQRTCTNKYTEGNGICVCTSTNPKTCQCPNTITLDFSTSRRHAPNVKSKGVEGQSRNSKTPKEFPTQSNPSAMMLDAPDPYLFDAQNEDELSALQEFQNKNRLPIVQSERLGGKPGNAIARATRIPVKRKLFGFEKDNEQVENNLIENDNSSPKRARSPSTISSSAVEQPYRQKKPNRRIIQKLSSKSLTKSPRQTDQSVNSNEQDDQLTTREEQLLRIGSRLRKAKKNCFKDGPINSKFREQASRGENPVEFQQVRAADLDILRVGGSDDSVMLIDAIEPEAAAELNVVISPTKPSVSACLEDISVVQDVLPKVVPTENLLADENSPERPEEQVDSTRRKVREKHRVKASLRQRSKSKKRSQKTRRHLPNSTDDSSESMTEVPEGDENILNSGSYSDLKELLNTGFHESLQPGPSPQPTSDELFDRLLSETKSLAQNVFTKGVTFADNLLVPDTFDPLLPNPSGVPDKPAIAPRKAKTHNGGVRVSQERMDEIIGEILRVVKAYVKYNAEHDRLSSIHNLISVKSELVSGLEEHTKWLSTIKEEVQNITKTLENLEKCHGGTIVKIIKILEDYDKKTTLPSSVSNVPRSMGDLREKIAHIWSKLMTENRDGSGKMS